MEKKQSIDFINGSILKSIFLFSVPLLIGNLFQQLYNTVDSYVVGNYVGTQALAAVGASSPIINMLIGFFMGLATGAGVIIAQFYGAGDHERLKKSIHSSAALTLVMAIIFTVVGLIATKPLLIMIAVPEDVLAESITYLSIYFIGIIFVFIYNIGTGILRALGDSKRPLYFLILGCVINIILDFLFVKYFKMGVAGAGWATLIAQGVSAILVVYILMKEKGPKQLILKEIKFDMPILKKIIMLGLPTGIQQSIVSLSNVVVQSYINSFGSSVMAGYSASIRIDGFINLPLQSFSMAVTTFVGQNIGARKPERVKKGANVTLLMGVSVVAAMSVILYFFGESFIAFFNNEAEVVKAGRMMQLVFLPGYVIIAISQILSGVVRGAGKSTAPMLFSVLNYVFLRQVYLFIVTKMTSSVVYVFMGWPLTWVTCTVMFLIYYFKVDWLKMDD